MATPRPPVHLLTNGKRHARPRRTFIEMFAGVGLVRFGLEQAGWECIFANDIDEEKAHTYEANFSPDSIFIDDIHNLTAKHIPAYPLLATASFPCQDLSLAGARAGLRGSRSGTFWGFISLLRKLQTDGRRPHLIMLENVPGLVTSHRGKDFEQVLASLNALGYLCNAALVDARWFVPQSRLRLFIFGVNAGSLGEPNTLYDSEWAKVFTPHLSSAVESSALHPPLLSKAIRGNRHIRWFPLPPIDRPANAVPALESIIEPDTDIPQDWWYEPEKVKRLLGRMWESHRKKVLDATRGTKRRVFTGYWRTRNGSPKFEVRFDSVAGCLRTPVGGSSKQSVILAGRGKIKARLLTPREYARLQGVPDSFMLPEDRNAGYMGMGDAVAVPAIKWVGEQILNPIAEKMKRVEVEAALSLVPA